MASDCPDSIKKQVDFWPIALEFWLPVTEHRHNRFPKKDLSCPPLLLMEPSFFICYGC